jgi:hypothetical protein
MLGEWQGHQRQRYPPVTPRVEIGCPPPLFTNMPRGIEQALIAADVEEDLLSDPRLDAALRRPPVDGWPEGAPRKVCVTYSVTKLWQL